jgi:hypothetical protein
MSRTKQNNLPSQKRRDEMNGYSRYRPSNAVEALLLEAVAKRKAKSEAETAKTIDKVKDQIEELTLMFGAEAERKTRAYTDTITNVKAVAKEKARASTDSLPKIKPSIIVGAIFLEAVAEQKAKSEAEAAEAIARIRAEAEEKARAYNDTIAKVKAESVEKVAEQKAKSEAEAAEAIARIRAEAEEKATTYTETISKLKAESVETAVEQKAQSETESVKKVAEQKAQSEAEAKKAIAKVRTKAEEAIFEVKTEAKELIDKVIIGPRIKEIVYPQRLSWSQWLLKGIREDNVTAVIVFCLLLCIVLSAFAVSGYFVYTLLRTFL